MKQLISNTLLLVNLLCITQLAFSDKGSDQIIIELKNTPSIQINMKTIPSGTFVLKSDSNQNIQTTIKVPEFRMMETEITWEMYEPCIQAGVCPENNNDKGWGKGDRPVIEVSWNDIQLYIKWLNNKTGLNFELPSEIQWEYAARAGTSTLYFWGDQIGVANASCDGCGNEWDDKMTVPVKHFKPNAYGLYDMHGSVWEIVNDCWDWDSQKVIRDDNNCSSKLWKGGSWRSYPEDLTSFAFTHFGLDARYNAMGFRLILNY